MSSEESKAASEAPTASVPTASAAAAAAEGDDIPIIDLNMFRSDPSSDGAKAECAKVAEGFHKYGVLILRDSRATDEGNDRFLDMVENYFEQPEETVRADVRPELSYQVGATPSFTELPRNHCERMKTFKGADAPLSLCPPEKDPKWRFFWRLGDRPAETKYADLNAPPVTPEKFPEWGDVMNEWGSTLLGAVKTLAEMTAIGFDMPPKTFVDMMEYGSHLLAPTASDFKKFGTEGTVLAGYHYDLNFITCHGKSRYPGLFIWTRDGRKLPVKVPKGCLLVQAGKQLEYLTAGHVIAGFHEVVVSDKTVAAIDRAREAGRSLWRISSTCFTAIQSDDVLRPLGPFADHADASAYPPIDAGAQVQAELEHIKLGSRATEAPRETTATALAAEAAAGSASGSATE